MEEKISALMDGELDERAADDAVELLRRDPRAAETWRLYHVASDAIHEQPMLGAPSPARLGARLAAEPGVLTASRLPGRTPAQRFLFAAAASLAAVALVAWLAFAPPPAAQLSLAHAQPAGSPAPLMLTEPA